MCKQLVYCPTCKKNVEYVIRCRVGDTVIHDVEIHYFEKYGICKECHSELYVPELEDVNELRAEDCYRMKLDLIPLSQFNSLVQDYGLDKLSKLSGVSYTNLQYYQAGRLVNHEDSEKLKAVCDNAIKEVK